MATAVTAPSMDSAVESFIARKQKLLINGKWVEAASGKTFPSYNPATGEVLANIAEGDREDINRAVTAARAAFESGPWAKMPPAGRAKLIWKLTSYRLPTLLTTLGTILDADGSTRTAGVL